VGAEVTQRPRIPLEDLIWESIGPADAPNCNLKASLQIGPALFHVEAIQVGFEEVQGAAHLSCFGTFEDFVTAIEPGGPFETIRITGREYAVFCYPYAK
jgi:hypothetical protein